MKRKEITGITNFLNKTSKASENCDHVQGALLTFVLPSNVRDTLSLRYFAP